MGEGALTYSIMVTQSQGRGITGKPYSNMVTTSLHPWSSFHKLHAAQQDTNSLQEIMQQKLHTEFSWKDPFHSHTGSPSLDQLNEQGHFLSSISIVVMMSHSLVSSRFSFHGHWHMKMDLRSPIVSLILGFWKLRQRKEANCPLIKIALWNCAFFLIILETKKNIFIIIKIFMCA